MRRLAPRRAALALAAFAEDLAPATTLARVQGCWHEVAGAAIAERAAPVAERDGTLTVACESAVWAQEIDLLAGDLVPRLNAALGARDGDVPLRSLRVVTGGLGGPEKAV